MDYLSRPYVVVARDQGIVAWGKVCTEVMTKEEFDAIPDWRKSEYTVYERSTHLEFAEGAASIVNARREFSLVSYL